MPFKKKQPKEILKQDKMARGVGGWLKLVKTLKM